MKNIYVFLVVLGCLCWVYAAKTGKLSASLSATQIEIAALEKNIAEARAAGQTPDAAWVTRLNELLSASGNISAKQSDEFSTPLEREPFIAERIIRPREVTPLEAQINELEFAYLGGVGTSLPDEVTRANLKEQLNELYAQRPENRERNALDQGNDACPATVVTGVPYYDSGTTTGRVNNFAPLQPCNQTNAPDVIYKFIPLATQTYHISLEGSSYDTYLYVNAGETCPGSTQVGCNDDALGLQSYLGLTLNAFQTYYIIIDGYSTNAGAYSLQISDSCVVECQPADARECVEVLGEQNLWNDCNGACNNESGNILWGTVQPFQTVCGVAFTYLDATGAPFRDTDFYRFTLNEPCSLRVTIETETPLQVMVGVLYPPCVVDDYYIMYPYSVCTSISYVTPCMPAGEMELFVGSAFATGVNEKREYRVLLETIPCNGCVVDGGLVAPQSISGSTVNAGNDCNLRSSLDLTYSITIPYASDWTFSLCGSGEDWDSYLYLTDDCCGEVIAEGGGGCGSPGLSELNCVPLTPGTYYLTIEGATQNDIGPVYLYVSDCIGACCYGEIQARTCEVLTRSECTALSGTFYEQTQCGVVSCYTRPECGEMGGLSAQAPHLPDEHWVIGVSDYETPFLQYDNYSVGGAIGQIRFWGMMVDWGAPMLTECADDPIEFELAFIDSAQGAEQIYTVSALGTDLGLRYNGTFPLLQFDVQFSPICTLTTGWLRIATAGSNECDFAWISTPWGDGIPGVTWEEEYGTYPAEERAFCLGSYCVGVDSLTIQRTLAVYPRYRLEWWQAEAGIVYIFSSDDASAVYPDGYSYLTGIGFPTPGRHFYEAPIMTDQRFFVVVRDCSGAQTGQPMPKAVPKR